jgi:hypothetical protein
LYAFHALLQDLGELFIGYFTAFMSESILRIEVRITISLASERDYKLRQSILFLDLVGDSFKQNWLLGCYLGLGLSIRKLYLRL